MQPTDQRKPQNQTPNDSDSFSLSDELRISAIGIKFSGELYHGSNIPQLTELRSCMRDHFGSDTLGPYIYVTDSREAGINYAVSRTRELGGLSTLYTSMVSDLNIADLSNPFTMKVLFPLLLEHVQDLMNSPSSGQGAMRRTRLSNFASYLRECIDKEATLEDIRDLLEGEQIKKFGFKYSFIDMIYPIGRWLEGNGFDGLRCKEGGEITHGLTPWQGLMTYAVFRPKSCSNLKEELVP